jgi:type II secretory pathway component GspD/PulD (secretin)
MSRSNAGRLTAGLILALGVGLWAASGQEKDTGKKADDGVKTKRIAYVVKHGTAKDLAPILSKYFKDSIEVQTLPEVGNCLLINASAASFDEVIKLLAQIDRPPQLIAVEVWIADMSKKDDKDETDLDLKPFTGMSSDVLSKLEGMQRKGQIGELRQLRLTLVEGRPSSIMLGSSKPVVAGTTTRGDGTVARSITYRNFGSQAKVTANVGTDKKINIDLDLSESRGVPNEKIPVGKDEAGKPIYATDIVQTRLESKVVLTAGRAVAVEGARTTSKSGKEQSLVIVTARIVVSAAGEEKDETEPVRPDRRPRRPRGGEEPRSDDRE